MSPSWLIVERSGALWAISRECLRGLERGPRLRLGDGLDVEVDAVHAVVRDLPRREVRPWVAPLLPEQVLGLGLWDGRPVAFLDPRRALPAFLATPPPSDAEREVP